MLEGKYTEATEPTSPVFGNFAVTFNEVQAKGKIPFASNQDSFYPENFNLHYTTRDNTTMDFAKTTKETIELNTNTTPIKEIWRLLIPKLNTMLERQFMAVFVEYSVQETLYDTDEPFKQYCKKKIGNNNKTMDKLIGKVTELIKSEKKTEIPTKDLNRFIKLNEASKTLENFVGTKGMIKDLSTLKRMNNFDVVKTSKGFKVFGELTFGTLQHEFTGCRYNAVENGRITTEYGYRTILYVILTFEKTGDSYLTSLQLKSNPGTLNIDISDDLVVLQDCIEGFTSSYLVQEVMPLLESFYVEKFNAVLSNDAGEFAKEFLMEELKFPY